MTRAQPSQANSLAGVARAWPAPSVPIPSAPRLADVLRRLRAAMSVQSRTSTAKPRPKRTYNPPRRESFMEEAAMRREMFRL